MSADAHSDGHCEHEHCHHPHHGHGCVCRIVVECGYSRHDSCCREVDHERCGHHGGDDDGDHEGKGGAGGDGTTTVGWHNPGRPGHTTGTSTGEIPGGQVTPGTFGTKPPNKWPGPRNEMYLPFLFMRANAGDLGARPVVGPFWESPDILLLSGVDPVAAPPKPPTLGDTALAGKPNTLYAHVWNFGLAPAPNVIVEFYWCNPTLGIGPSGANLIGQTMVSLGARGSGKSHAVVKCPVAWVPTFVNGGHECLVVRIWEETSDGLGTPPWDAALNRHLAQRNIHVIAAGDPGNLVPHLHAMASRLAPIDAALLALATPLTLRVGPLYGEPATVAVERAAPHTMPWLQQRTGTRGQFPSGAQATGAVTLSPPVSLGGGIDTSGAAGAQTVHHDDQQITFTTGDTMPQPGQAHVYRVTASQQGQVFGGYTVVLLG